MKHIRSLAACTAASVFSLMAAVAVAQAPAGPKPSPSAKVSQDIGTTTITVEYSSPGVKKRKVFTELAPAGKMWRTGANSSTKLTANKDITVGGKPVPAGTYSLLTIPGKTWTVILNKDTTIGGNMDKYKESEDVARFTVAPKSIPSRERLTFLFSDFTDTGGNLDLEWEKVRVSIPITVSSEASANAAPPAKK
jgi:hypothetical protein